MEHRVRRGSVGVFPPGRWPGQNGGGWQGSDARAEGAGKGNSGVGDLRAAKCFCVERGLTRQNRSDTRRGGSSTRIAAFALGETVGHVSPRGMRACYWGGVG